MLKPVALLACLALCPAAAGAQEFPSRPVQLVVGATAGAAVDLLARFMAEGLSAKLGQRVVVDNRPTAGGAVAAENVAGSRPDGYTVLLVPSSAMTLAPHLNSGLRWNPLRDFAPIVEIGTTSVAIAVPQRSPHKTLPELVEAARRAPGKLNSGVLTLTMSHFANLMLNRSAGVEITVVPYKLQADMINGALGGEADMVINGVGSLLHLNDSGLRLLAITGTRRIAALPTVPTVAEHLPGFEAESWFGIFGPAKLDPKAQSVLNGAVNEMLKEPVVRSRIVEMATEPTGGPPDALGQRVARDLDRFGKLIQSAKITTN